MKRRFYRPELDIVRLIAFLTVFFYHSASGDARSEGVFLVTLASAASFGLPLFFVLSAYLITTLLLREVESTGTVAIGRFYERRILRIWPLYLASLLIGLAWSYHHHFLHIEWRWYLSALLMSANLVGLAQPGPIAHLWSISVEEQFYLFWPALTRWLSRRHLIVAAVVLIVVANLMLVHDGLHLYADYVMWFSSLVQFEMFAAGILLAIITADQRTWLTSFRIRLSLISLVPILWFGAEYYFDIRRAGLVSVGPVRLCLGYAVVAISCALLIYAFLGSTGWPKSLVHMGKVSYGLYVFHLPVVTLIGRSTLTSFWLKETLALLATSILALVSYRFFETPFLKIKQRLEVIPSRPVEQD